MWCTLLFVDDLLEVYVLGHKLNNSQPATPSSEIIHLFHKRMCCRVHIVVQTLRPPTATSPATVANRKAMIQIKQSCCSWASEFCMQFPTALMCRMCAVLDC